MKKMLFMLSCLLIISLFSSAQVWNISSGAFNALGNITATTTVDGLTIYAASDKAVTVDESAKTINGMDFTHRLKLGGAGTLTANVPVSRVLAFNVTGPVNISLALQSSSSSADRELCLVSSVTGDTLHIFPAPGATAAWAEYAYTGEAQTLYLLSKASGINIYYLSAEASPAVNPLPAVGSRTIFDPATVDPSTLNSGFEVVSIDGTSYLKVTLAGWGSWTAIPQVALSGVTQFKCKAKFEAGTSGQAASTVNTFIKLVNPSWGEIGAKGAVSTDAFTDYTVPVTTPATAAILQIAGQSNVNWSAITGGIIYIGKIEAIDGSVAALDNDFMDSNAAGFEVVKGGNMEDASLWNFYYNSKDAKDTLGTIQFNYTGDKPAAGSGGCYRVSTYGQSATFLWQKITLMPGHTYRFNGAFKNAAPDATTNVWLEYGIMKNQPTGGEIATSEFSYVYNLNTWMGADTLDVDTTFENYFPFSGSNSNTFKLPESETDTEWFVVIKTGCWNDLGVTTPTFDLLFDDVSIRDLTPNVVKGGNMEDPSAWNFYYNSKDAKDTLGTIQFNYTADGPAAGEGGCYRVSTYGQSATFLYQPITVIPGHRYTFSGAFKNAAPDATTNVWLEYGIMKNQPTGGEIATSEFSYVYNLNTWMGADTLDVDTTFEDYFPLSGSDSKVITIPDTITDTQWFIVIKTGCWNDLGSTTPTFDLLFDNIALYDVSYANTGGNMEDPLAWNFYYNSKDAKDTLGTIEFNYRAEKPAAGKGGCYRVSTYGQSATFLYQPVDIIAGHRYQLTGAFKNASDSTANTWLEFGVMRNQPAGGEVTTGEFSYVYNLNTWMGADTLNVDTTFPAYFPFTGGANGTFVVPDTVTDTRWYILIKTGCWNELGNTDPTFDFLFDEVYLIDLGLEPWITLPVANVVVGSVTDAADFSASVKMKYDADSVYMVFSAVDDVIVNTGTSYQVDNIEVYFDMDNSKNIHWPRNGGWRAAIDEAYDANDYQLRLVPDVAFATNNKARPSSASIDSGYKQVYTRTATGFEFELTIAWETLMPGFAAEAGTTIGFDVLWSDNDVSASDANRNQITWNAPTDKPFNDPSLFGELVLTPSGSFIVNSDTEKPSAPANVVAVATGNSVLVTWDASTDNRAMMSYILYDKTAALDTVYAAETGNKYTFTNVPNGTHRYGVIAVDNYGNKSAKVAAEQIDIQVSAEQIKNTSFSVYPNPTTGMVNIVSFDNKAAQVAIYNVAGEKIKSGTFTGKYTLDMSDAQKGVYFIRYTSDQKTETSKLVVK